MAYQNQLENRTYQPVKNSIQYKNPWKIRKYEIFFTTISLIKIPVLAYFFAVENSWFMIMYIMFLGLPAIFCDYCYGSVIAKLCRSTHKIVFSCLIITLMYFALAILLLFLKTGGNDFESCADACYDVDFGFGVSFITPSVLIPMLIVFMSSMIAFKSLNAGKK